MRKLIVNEWMTLDGVVQAPGLPDENTDGGFAHGGWAMGYFDETTQKWVMDSLTAAGGYVLGRRTYEILAAYWPHASEEEQVIAEPLNTLPKYVASTTLTEPLAWENSTVLHGDIPQAVTILKEEDGGDLNVIGSAKMVHTLFEHGLVDELKLMIAPLMVGGGKRTFPDDGARRSLQLVEHQVTTTGAILATYATEA